MTEAAATGPRVFISWAHRHPDWTVAERNAWRTPCSGFANALVGAGIETEVDLWHEHELGIDRTRWGQQPVDDSDHVLIALSRAWAERWAGRNDPSDEPAPSSKPMRCMGSLVRIRRSSSARPSSSSCPDLMAVSPRSRKADPTTRTNPRRGRHRGPASTAAPRAVVGPAPARCGAVASLSWSPTGGRTGGTHDRPAEAGSRRRGLADNCRTVWTNVAPHRGQQRSSSLRRCCPHGWSAKGPHQHH